MSPSIKNRLFGAKKINAFKFGLAGGITIGIFFALANLLALFDTPGFVGLCNVVGIFYGPWGYSISPLGIVVGILYSFGDSFIIAFVIAWVYNKLLN